MRDSSLSKYQEKLFINFVNNIFYSFVIYRESNIALNAVSTSEFLCPSCERSAFVGAASIYKSVPKKVSILSILLFLSSMSL